MNELTHLDQSGAARMVDVSSKAPSEREAIAEATVALSEDAFAAISDGTAPKGDVLAAARIAGIMAAKKTSELIPLCHPLALTGANVDFELVDDRNEVRIRARIKTTGQTGVEMEALTAASIAALTIYDMIKAVDKSASIGNVHLVSKSGGKSGDYTVSAPSDGRAKAAPGGGRARAKSKVLIGATGAAPDRAQRQTADSRRDAFRNFMQTHRLRASVWAKESGVSSSQLYAYLTGRLSALPADVVEKLARIARVRAEDMFR